MSNAEYDWGIFNQIFEKIFRKNICIISKKIFWKFQKIFRNYLENLKKKYLENLRKNIWKNLEKNIWMKSELEFIQKVFEIFLI